MKGCILLTLMTAVKKIDKHWTIIKYKVNSEYKQGDAL